jgi:hypothetical protein
MSNRVSPQFRRLLRAAVLPALTFLAIDCQPARAAQRAKVIADKAFIYADLQMSSPIGFVTKGKLLTVGEVPRNKSQVYPIVVSGKVAFIRVVDVTTEEEELGGTEQLTRRFQQRTRTKVPESRVAASYFAYASSVNLGDRNAELEDGDGLTWRGLNLRAEVLMKNRVDIFILGNVMETSYEEEIFRVFELGAGVGYRLLDLGRLRLRADAQLLAIPFSTYSLGDEFRVRSYGYSAGSNLHLAFRFGAHWGVEAYSGVFYTGLAGFNSPDPYQDVAPSFYGARLGGGLNYTFE